MIPDFQKLMLPLLKFSADQKEHTTSEAIKTLAEEFNLTTEELNEWLPSKTQRIFHNRVHWAKAYLKMAGLVENPKRSYFRITPRGLMVLNEPIEEINIKFLKRFPEFNNSGSKGKSHRLKDSDGLDAHVDNKTPEELLEEAYDNINDGLKADLLWRVKNLHPANFEKLVVNLLVRMGYGGTVAEAGKATQYTNDEGIDGIIKEDKLGLDIIYIQAKKWEGNISRPEIQKFVGALAGKRAKKGVFITTSSFTKEAETYASQMDTKIVLIDGAKLAEYMIEYNLGVSVQSSYEIKKIDLDYFEED